MPGTIVTINQLKYLFEDKQEIDKQLNSIRGDLYTDPLFRGTRLQELDRRLKDCMNKMEMELMHLLKEPPHHDRHHKHLAEFHQRGSFEDSIFIMTKFPENNSPADRQLEKVIKHVMDGIKKIKNERTGEYYIPRIASDKDYHNLLWDNVELYLLGCSKAVAIVEDKYLKELNPNVAMEWGWMRGMGKDVLFLVEKDFINFRADWSGLTKHEFDWNNPGPGINNALTKWLS